MVAIVSGSGLGLFNSSVSVLGQQGMLGAAANGNAKEGAYVNAANGNLILQRQDDILTSRGFDAGIVRTYNSQGKLNDDNGDNWRIGLYKSVGTLTGTVNTAGSTVTRTDADAVELVYTYDTASAKYVNKDGAGSYDTLTYSASTTKWTWTDGDSRATESYDWVGGSGKLLSVTDIDGNILKYTYTGSLLTRVLDASGESAYLDYVGNNLSDVRIVKSDGSTVTRTRYAYDSSNRLTTVTVDLSPNDNGVANGYTYVNTYTYDGTSRRVASTTQSDGSTLSFTYISVNGGWRVASVTDALNRTTTFAYTEPGGIRTVTDPLGNQTTFVVDVNGQLTKIIAPAVDGVAQETTYTYDASGNVTRIVDPRGNGIDMTYDASGNMTLQRDALGNTVKRTYGATRNELLTETVYLTPDPDGSGSAQPGQPLTTRYVYDTKKHLRFEITAEGRVTEYRYNALGEKIAALKYNGSYYDVSTLAVTASPTETQVTTWLSNAATNKVDVNRVDYAYDLRGQLSTTTVFATVNSTSVGTVDGTQSVTSYVRDQSGLLLSTIDANSKTTQFVYDGLGRIIANTDAAQNVTVTTYDDVENRVSTTLANGLTNTFVYSRTGDLITAMQSDSSVDWLGETKYQYDSNGRLGMVENPNGERTFLIYDAAGRKVGEVGADWALTEYVYNADNQIVQTIQYADYVDASLLLDSDGNLSNISVSDMRPVANALDRKSWNIYDNAGRLVKSVDPLGYVTQFDYDGASEVQRTVRYATAIDVSTLGSVLSPSSVAPVVSNDDRVTRSFYNKDKQLQGLIDAEGFLTEYVIDAGGHVSQAITYSTVTNAATRFTASLSALRPSTTASDVRQINLYDGKGLLVGKVDGEDYLTEFKYDRNGNTTQTIRYATKVSYANGMTLTALRPQPNSEDHLSSATYTALNQVDTETSVNGTVTQYVYDSVGNLTSSTRGVATVDLRAEKMRYDSRGRLIAALTAEGTAILSASMTQAEIEGVWNAFAIRYEYDSAGQRTSMTDQNGNRSVYYYDEMGHLAITIDATGAVVRRNYDALGNFTFSTSYATRLSAAQLTALPGGRLLADWPFQALLDQIASDNDSWQNFEYDQSGRVVTNIDAIGIQTTYGYDAFGDVTARAEFTDYNGNAVRNAFRYDRRGQLIETHLDPAGGNLTTLTQYDAFGRAIKQTDANGNVQTMTFDRLGRAVAIKNPLDPASVTTYDAFDRVLTQVDSLSHVTTYQYDTQLRKMTITTAEGIVQSVQSNRYGQQTVVIDGNNNTTTFAYDKNGKLRSVTNALGEVITHTYDRVGNEILTEDANGNKTAFSYDAANRILSKVYDPDGANHIGLKLTTSYTYDTKGRVLSVTDPRGIVTETEYDVQGNATAIIVDRAGLNQVTSFGHDGRGKVLLVTDPNGHSTEFLYDDFGRRAHEIRHLASGDLTTDYEYDNNGNLRARIDANGSVTRYVVDAENRVTYEVDGAGNTAHYEYDANSRLVKTTRYASAIETATLGRALAEIDITFRLLVDGTRDNVVRNIYDLDGRLAFTVDTLGAVTQRLYDKNGNTIRSVAYATKLPVGTFDTFAQLTAAVTSLADPAHDAVSINAYDKLNRVTAHVDGNGAVTTYQYDAAGNVVDRIGYAKTIAIGSLAQNPSADSIIALVVKDPAHDVHQRTAYDAANRATATATAQFVDAGNVLQWAVSRQSYDKNGNVVSNTAYATSLSSSALPSNPTTTDISNWINGVTSDPVRDVTTRMAYDANNRMVYTIDGVNAVTELVYDKAGNVVQRIAYNAPVNVAGTVDMVTISQAVVHNAALDRTTHMVYDEANRAVTVIDALGNTEQRTFDAVGNITSKTRNAGAGVGGQASRTTSYVYDADSRLRYAIDAEGYVTQTDYDALGHVTRTIQYEASMSVGAHPTRAQVESSLQPNGLADRANTFLYDAQGNLTKSTDAMGGTEFYTYDALGRKASFTNKLGAVWNYQYDAAGRLAVEIDPEVAIVRGIIGVDGDGKPTYVPTTAATRIETHIAYDALGNVTARTEAFGQPEARTTSYRYDAVGRQIQVITPPVSVYSAASDNLAANGAAGNAQRSETAETTLTTTVIYDALGNAVVNKDVAGVYSYKTYDVAGRVRYEVDAKGYVTGYDYDEFGAVTKLTRYGAPFSVAGRGAVAIKTAEVAAYLQSADHTSDRVVTKQYDALGRVIKVVEPQTDLYDARSTTGSLYVTAGKATVTRYDAFGDAISQSVFGENASGVAVTQAKTTAYYYDARGNKRAQIVQSSGNGSTAMGYLTTMNHDVAGNLTAQTEYASEVTNWSDATFGIPVSNAKDRSTQISYDLNNRKISEGHSGEFSVAPDGSSTTGYSVTTFAYDAVGNMTRTTDPLGSSTYTYYDKLGRVVAVAAPTALRRTQLVELGILIWNQAPDSASMAALTAQLESGKTLAEVAQWMMANGVGPSFYPASLSNAGIVNEMYALALRRSPSQVDMTYWTGELTRTGSPGDVAVNFIKLIQQYQLQDSVGIRSKEEFNIRVAAGVKLVAANGSDPSGTVTLQAVEDARITKQVSQLYVALFNRAPDAEGLTYWSAQLRAGKTPGAVAQEIYNLEGTRSIYPSSMSATDFVTRVYSNAFGRAPDAAGLTYWAGTLNTPGATRGGLIASIANEVANYTESDPLGLASQLRFNEKVAASMPDTSAWAVHVSPLTEFKLDIYGNVVQRIDYARGAENVSNKAYTSAGPDATDRVTSTVFDRMGHAIETIDAEHNATFVSYDAFGRVAKQWQTFTKADGTLASVKQTAYKQIHYDELGRLDRLSQSDSAGTGIDITTTEYNAFGEVTRTVVDGKLQEYRDYDNAGRTWRTNAGDGVNKVMLHDIDGNTTAELKSTSLDLKSAAFTSSADVVNRATGLLRTETQYDLMGHAISQSVPSRTETDVASTAGRTFVSVDVLQHSGSVNVQSGDSNIWKWQGTNEVKLNWMSLAGLGSGDVRVVLEYTSNEVKNGYTNDNGDFVVYQDDRGAAPLPFVAAEHVTYNQIFSSGDAETGATLRWTDMASFDNIDKIKISKKDVDGKWVELIVQSKPGESGSFMRINAPIDLTTKVSLQYRVAGSTGAFITATVSNFGESYLFNTSALAEGNYEYQILYQSLGDPAPVIHDTGVLTVASTVKRTQITELYTLLFNRAPDHDGLAYWVHELERGEALNKVAQRMFESGRAVGFYPAAMTNGALVDKLFGDALGRPADTEGRNYWTAQLDTADIPGKPEGAKGQIFVDLINAIKGYASNEPKALTSQKLFNNKVAVGLHYAVDLGGNDPIEAAKITKLVTATSITAATAASDQAIANAAARTLMRTQIAQLYVLLFNRAPDATGMAHWLADLEAGHSRAEVAKDMYQSGITLHDFPASITSTELVDKIFRGAFGHAPTAANLSDWKSKLDNAGQSKGAVFIDMIDNFATQQKLFNNKVGVGLYYGVTLGGNDPIAAAAIVQAVTADDTLAAAAQAAASATTGSVGTSTIDIAKATADADAAAVLGTNAGKASQAWAASTYPTLISQLFVFLFNRAPEEAGMTYWLAQLTNGTSKEDVARDIYLSGVPTGDYPATMSGADIVTKIYRGALGREPDSEGLAYWAGELDKPGAQKGAVFLSMIASFKSPVASNPLATNSAKLFNNKVAVGLTYALNLHGKDIATAASIIGLVTATDVSVALAAASGGELAQLRTDVTQMYIALRGHGPTFGELNDKIVRIKAGTSLAAIAQLIYADSATRTTLPDGISSVTLVTNIYHLAFNRAPDADGLDYWARQIDAGVSHADPAMRVNAIGRVVVNLLNTSKAYAGTDSAALAGRAYLNTSVETAMASIGLGGGIQAAALAAAVNAYASIKSTDAAAAAVLADATVLAANAASTAATAASAAAAAASAAAAATAAAAAATAAGASSASTSTTEEAKRRILVTQVYVALLGHGPTLQELNASVSSLASTTQIGPVAQAIYASAQATALGWNVADNTAFVTKVFQVGLNRTPISSDLTHWVAMLNTQSRGQVLSDILYATANYTGTEPGGVASKNFFDANVLAALTSLSANADAAKNVADQAVITTAAAVQTATSTATTAFNNWVAANATATNAAAAVSNAQTTTTSTRQTQITELYVALYGRAPDLQGLTYWSAALSTKTLAQVVEQFPESPNGPPSIYVTASNTQFINDLFIRSFGGPPLAPDLQYWTNQLATNTRGQVLVDIVTAAKNFTAINPAGLASKTIFEGKVAAALAVVAAEAAAAKTTATNDAASLNAALATANGNVTTAGNAVANANSAYSTASSNQSSALGIATSAAYAATNAAQSGSTSAMRRMQIAALYIAIFNRSVLDMSGFNNWVTEMEGGKSLALVAQDMFNVSYIPTSSIVSQVYSNALGRSPSQTDLNDWNGNIYSGTPIGQVIVNIVLGAIQYNGVDPAGASSRVYFDTKINNVLSSTMSLASSDRSQASNDYTNAVNSLNAANSQLSSATYYESNALTAKNAADSAASNALYIKNNAVSAASSYTAQRRAQVTAFYYLLLNHGPDYTGLEGWVSSGATLANIAESIYLNPSVRSYYPDGISNSQFVTQLYSLGTNQYPDSTGFNYWVGQLNGGASKFQVIADFAYATANYSGGDYVGQSSMKYFNDRVSSGLSAIGLGGADIGTVNNATAEYNRLAGLASVASQNYATYSAQANTARADVSAATSIVSTKTAAYALADKAVNEISSAVSLASTALSYANSASSSANAVGSTAAALTAATATKNAADSALSLATAAAATASQNAAIANAKITDITNASAGLTIAITAANLSTNAAAAAKAAADLKLTSDQASLDKTNAIQLSANAVTAASAADQTKSALATAVVAITADAAAAAAAASAGANAESLQATANNAKATAQIEQAKADQAAADAAAIPEAKLRTQITQLYLMLSKPAPTHAQLNAAVAELKAGRSLSAIAQDIYQLPQMANLNFAAMSDAQFLTSIYSTGLNRPVDATAMTYWTGQLATKSRGEVVVDIVNSTMIFNDLTSVDGNSAKAYLTNRVAIALGLDVGYANQAKIDAHAAADAAANASNGAPLSAQDKTLVMLGQVAELYISIYNRAPELDGLAYWTGQLESGKSFSTVARDMLAVPEAQTIYPPSSTNAQFVAKFFTTALGRTATQSDTDYWGGEIQKLINKPMAADLARAQILTDLINSTVAYQGTNPVGLESKALFNNKVGVGLTYAIELGGNNVSAAARINGLVTAASTVSALAEATASAHADDTIATASSSAPSVIAAMDALAPSERQLMQVAQLYVALQGQAPVWSKVREMTDRMAAGETQQQIAQRIYDDVATRDLYAANLTDAQFITQVYQVAFHRSPDASGQDYWTTQLAGKSATAAASARAQILVDMVYSLGRFTGTAPVGIASAAAFNNDVLTALTSIAASSVIAQAAALSDVAKANVAGSSADAAKVIAAMLAAGSTLITSGDLTGHIVTGPKIIASTFIRQTVDRWGNVLSITDARNPDWKTEYQYNANNQVTSELKPIVDGARPETRTYYDQLGRAIATRDANGNVNGVRYNLNGDLVEELHADGGSVHYTVNTFGDRIKISQANGTLTAYSYDHLGHVLTATTGSVDVYSSAFLVIPAVRVDFSTALVSRSALVTRYAYDELGRRIQTTDADGKVSYASFDAYGNVTGTTAYGVHTTSRYDALRHKTDEENALGTNMHWDVDAFGRVHDHTDLGGRVTHSEYDQAGRLVFQTASAVTAAGMAAQELRFEYDDTGLVTKIDDRITGKVTTYRYDLAGNRVRERTAITNSTSHIETVAQDNHISYDSNGRVLTIADGRYHVDYKYDANGNRINVNTRYETQDEDPDNSQIRTDRVVDLKQWNAFDKMNRQTIIDGELIAGTGKIDIGTNGHAIAYDNSGNRLLDRSLGMRAVDNGSGGQPSWTATAGVTTELYVYDNANRLTNTYRDGLEVDTRRYDAAGRVIASGALTAGGNLNDTLAKLGVDTEIRTNVYNDNGRIERQHVTDLQGTQKVDMVYDHYDAVGNLVSYVQDLHGDGSFTDRFTSTMVGIGDGYQALSVARTKNGSAPVIGQIGTTFDANGFAVGITDSKQPANNRTMINDASGRVLTKTQDGRVTHALIVNGEYLGSSASSNKKGVVSADTFGSNYVPVSAASLTAAPTTYTVQQGDTLQSIAKAVWGDASLWYLIADANNVVDLKDKVGVAINIPTRGNTVHNDYRTFKPYNASEAVGDVTPGLAMPAGDDGCGAIGQVLIIAIAVVATMYTAGLLSGAGAGLFEAVEAGATLLQGGAATAGLGTIGTAAVAGAVGSAVSQGVAIAIGAQDSFSWKGVALSAIGAGVTAGVGSSELFGNAIVRAAVSNTITQGIGVVTGLQPAFSWTGVAAAAVGAGVGGEVDAALKGPISGLLNSDFGGRLASGTISGFAAGVATSVLRGGRISVTQIAIDAFGNALGSSVAGANWGGSQQEPVLGATFADDMAARKTMNYWNPQAGARHTAEFDPSSIPTFSDTSPMTEGQLARLESTVAGPESAISPETLRRMNKSYSASLPSSDDLSKYFASANSAGETRASFSDARFAAEQTNLLARRAEARASALSGFSTAGVTLSATSTSAVGGFDLSGNSTANRPQFDLGKSVLADIPKIPLNLFANTVEMGTNFLSLTVPGNPDYVPFMDFMKAPYNSEISSYVEFGTGLFVGRALGRTGAANLDGAPILEKATSTILIESLEIKPVRGPYATLNGEIIEPRFMNQDLFHGDTMSMSEIIDAGGLPTKGANIDLMNHLDGGKDSAFRGTNLWADSPLMDGNGPVGWAGPGGTVVRIDGSKIPSYDANALTRGRVQKFDGTFADHKWTGEGELSVHANVPLNAIKQFGVVKLNPRTQAPYIDTWLDNPHYKK